jgi:hypothetical protein
MTDSHISARIDLRALDEPVDPAAVDRILESVLKHVASNDPVATADLLTRLGTVARPVIAAAALLIGCAAAILYGTDRSAATPLTPLSSWAQAQRVPTNGELLAAFHGYEK